MADGMTGHLPEVSPWCDIKTSAWASPTGSGEYPWEEAPYWLKGFGDLGYVLHDQRIIDECKQWIDGFLAGQMDDGYLGPRVNVAEKDKPVGLAGGTEKLDLWPNMIMLNVLQSRYEATGDERILDAMTKYFRWQLNLPENNILPGYWDRMRGGDNLESIYWLYNRTGDEWLLDAAKKVHASTAPWSKTVPNWHGVNITQGFREGTLWSMLSHDAADRASAERNYDEVMGKYGQMPGGMFAADENAREGYDDPRQAAETCSMVEFMHSFEMLARETGTPAWADRCEDVAFNSLPAALTADMRGLHYLTAANDVALTTADKNPGIQNGGNMYAYTPDGDPNRCCQHNHGHGWPYFAESLWMATQDNGLAALLYAPSRVTAKVGDAGQRSHDRSDDGIPLRRPDPVRRRRKGADELPHALPHPRLGQVGGADRQRRGAEDRVQARRLPPRRPRLGRRRQGRVDFPHARPRQDVGREQTCGKRLQGPAGVLAENRAGRQDVLGEEGQDDRLDGRGGHADDAVELRLGAGPERPGLVVHRGQLGRRAERRAGPAVHRRRRPDRDCGECEAHCQLADR